MKLFCPKCKKKQESTNIEAWDGNYKICNLKWEIDVRVLEEFEDVGYERIWEDGTIDDILSESESYLRS